MEVLPVAAVVDIQEEELPTIILRMVEAEVLIMAEPAKIILQDIIQEEMAW